LQGKTVLTLDNATACRSFLTCLSSAVLLHGIAACQRTKNTDELEHEEAKEILSCE